MITKKRVLNIFSCAIFTITTQANATMVKSADEVFKKWTSWQQIMPDLDLTTMTHNIINEQFATLVKLQYEKNASSLAPLTPFLEEFTAKHINQNGYLIKSPLHKLFLQNLTNLYEFIQNDMSSFIAILKSYQLEETGSSTRSSNSTIEAYNNLFRLLFAQHDENVQNEYLFTVANKFHEYCFSQKTFPEFQKLMFDKQSYPIARMLYSVSWLNLAGSGWKHWHENSLKILQERAGQDGHQVVYIAGGSDLYQLIKAGIYNIKNIDPQLPSQPKYYAEDWEYVLHGALGDKIIFNFGNRVIVMERVAFSTPGTTFKARIATGEIIELPHSITTWTLSDPQGNKLGEYTLERRFCEQSDFNYAPNKTLLISFNELHFVSLPSFLNGWNIDPSRFDDNTSIVVKQLAEPVDKQVIMNMRIASMLNSTDFKFIALGTCIN